jgi:uncharacterized membrane protein (UPF0127 family)
MRKLSWPPFSEMNSSMEPQGDSAMDIAMDSNLYDSFVPGKYTMSETEVPAAVSTEVPPGIEEGMIFPVKSIHSDIEEDEEEALAQLSEKFLQLIAKESTILGIGKQTDEAASIILKEGHNLINLSKDTSNKVNIHKFHQEYGNPMFHSFRNKFDGFYITSAPKENNILEITLNNICNNLKAISCGLIVSQNSTDISSIIEKFGFVIIDNHINKIGKYLVAKNNLDKMAVVRYYGDQKNNDASIIFKCDVAKTHREKIDGLQVYSKLGKEAGLLFPYDRPTDVFYHMGSVSYPIDIIFIDKDSKIKKICRNAQPGSLEVYSCSEVSSVLEISGGLSDVLGIKESNSIYIEYGSDFDSDLFKMANIIKNIGIDKCIFKRSNLLNTGFYNILNNKIYVINNNDNQHSVTQIVKKASLNYKVSKEIIAFDIDNLFLNNEIKIKLYKHKAPDEDSRMYQGLHNEVFSIDKKGYVDVRLSDIVSKGFYQKINANYSMIPNECMRFENLDNTERNKALDKVQKAAADSKNLIVFVSRGNNDKALLENFIEKEIEIKTGSKISIASNLLRVPDSYSTEDIFSALGEKYSGDKIKLYSGSLIKSAGIPVPDDVKSKAKHAARYFDRSKDMCNDLIENFNKNLSEYQKVQGNNEAIVNSKGKYSQSSKRNSRITKRMLINIKNGIKILNEIKDISTTSEIISAIAASAKNASEVIKEIFNLIEILDSDDFVNQCSQKTQNSENTLNDLRTVLSRANDYINSDILGLLILSE